MPTAPRTPAAISLSRHSSTFGEYSLVPLEPRLCLHGVIDVVDVGTLVPAFPVYCAGGDSKLQRLCQTIPGDPLLPVSDRGLHVTPERLNVDHKKEFTKVVATFKDDQLAGGADHYEAIIDWGDGATTVGTILLNADGGYDVVGASSYKWGWHEAKVTVREVAGEGGASPRSGTVTTKVYVIPPPIAGHGHLVKPTAGRPFSKTVASYVGLDTDMLDRYEAVIHWGDGNSTQGVLRALDNGVVRVVGAYNYESPGHYDIHVTLREKLETVGPSRTTVPGLVIDGPFPIIPPAHNSPGTARGRAAVAEGSVHGKLMDISATTGIPEEGFIGRFKVADAHGGLSHYSATIEWAGGEPVPAPIVRQKNGWLLVRMTGVLLEQEQRATVRIHDDRVKGLDKTVGIARRFYLIKTHLEAKPARITATEGIEFSGVVGHIRSAGSGTLWSSAFETVIHWGDGTSSPGQVILGEDGWYDVVGTHTYAVEGADRQVILSISVTETRTPLDESLPSGTRTYHAYASGYRGSAILHGDIDGFVLRLIGYDRVWVGPRSILLGTMFVGDPSLDAEAYAGVMTWEDGSSSALRFERIADDRFEVYVDATFDRPGRQKADYVITGAGMQRTGSVEFNVYQSPVSPPPIGQVRVQSVNAVKGIAYSLVSAFTPADPSIPISQYSAEIGWGDGSSSPAALRLGPDGQIQIIAEHTYRRVVNSGDYGPYVYVHVRLCERSAYTQTWVSVAVDPTRINAFGRDDMHFRQREEFTSRVGYFTSPDEHAKASDFEVWIDWGDGKQSLGTVVSRFEGGFDVLGTHTYKVSGYRNITFTVAGPTNADTGESRITLDRDPVEVTPRKPDIGKRSIKGTLATFIDEDGDSTDSERYRVYHAALIDWGDGRFDFGQVVREVDGTFRVDGAHTYRKSGEYLVKLFVRRNERYLPGMYSPVMYDVAARNGLSHTGIQGSEEYSAMLFKVRIGKSTAKVLAGRKSAPPLQKAPVRAASLFSTMRIPRDLGLLA